MNLGEIKQALEESTQGKWEWRGRIAPNWMPDTFSTMDDLRVEIPTPEKDYDADLRFVIQPMKPGFVMVRNTDAKLIANAPDYLKLLLPVVETAIAYIEAIDDENYIDASTIRPKFNEALTKLKGEGS